jgi:hypothetical protein
LLGGVSDGLRNGGLTAWSCSGREPLTGLELEKNLSGGEEKQGFEFEYPL